MKNRIYLPISDDEGGIPKKRSEATSANTAEITFASKSKSVSLDKEDIKYLTITDQEEEKNRYQPK